MNTEATFTDRGWWEAEQGEVSGYLQSWIDGVLQTNNRRFTDYVRFAGLYGNWDAAPVMGSFLASGVPYGRFYKRASFNLTQSMVDTVVNQRSSEYSRLQATSIDGNFRQFMIAKGLTMALRNAFESQSVESKFYGVVRDALVFGPGLWTVTKKDGAGTGKPARPSIERQFSPEVVCDPFENITDGFPYSFDVSRFVSRKALAAKYPGQAAAIMAAPVEPGHYMRVRGDDNVRVDEAWTTTRNGKVGRHVCCVLGADLCDEPYDYEEPPFVVVRWSPSFQGWYCQGLVDQLMGLQLKENELLDIISEAHSLFAHPMMLVEQTSNFNTKLMQDVPGKVMTYLKTKPEILKAEMISQEVYAHLDRIYNRAYQIAGISPYVAQAKTINRMESSKAQRSMQDMNDQRHFSFARQCEEATEKLAKLYCRVAAECDDENGYVSRMPVSAYITKFSWKEATDVLDKFQIKIGSVNPLMAKTSEQLSEVQEMAGLGQLTPTQLRQYLDNPDIQRASRLATASDDYIDNLIHCLTVDEEPFTPKDAITVSLANRGPAFAVVVQHFLVGERVGWHSEKARTNLFDLLVYLRDQIVAGDPSQAPGTPAMQGSTQPQPGQAMAGQPQPQQPQQINIQNTNAQGQAAPSQG